MAFVGLSALYGSHLPFVQAYLESITGDNMKNRKVLVARCHIGAGIQSKLTFSAKDPTGKELDGEMELWPIGVYVKKYELLLPFTNLTSVSLSPEEIEDEKRGPGRPPGPRAA